MKECFIIFIFNFLVLIFTLYSGESQKKSIEGIEFRTDNKSKYYVSVCLPEQNYNKIFIISNIFLVENKEYSSRQDWYAEQYDKILFEWVKNEKKSLLIFGIESIYSEIIFNIKSSNESEAIEGIQFYLKHYDHNNDFPFQIKNTFKTD